MKMKIKNKMRITGGFLIAIMSLYMVTILADNLIQAYAVKDNSFKTSMDPYQLRELDMDPHQLRELDRYFQHELDMFNDRDLRELDGFNPESWSGIVLRRGGGSFIYYSPA